MPPLAPSQEADLRVPCPRADLLDFSEGWWADEPPTGRRQATGRPDADEAGLEVDDPGCPCHGGVARFDRRCTRENPLFRCGRLVLHINLGLSTLGDQCSMKWLPPIVRRGVNESRPSCFGRRLCPLRRAGHGPRWRLSTPASIAAARPPSWDQRRRSKDVVRGYPGRRSKRS
jgi:hypothetical protein